MLYISTGLKLGVFSEIVTQIFIMYLRTKTEVVWTSIVTY